MTSDTCNGERNKCRLIVDQVHESEEDFRKYDSDDIHVLEVDFWNHLRNMCIGGMPKALTILLVNTLREELDDIDSRMRVSKNIKSVLRDVNK